MDSNAKPKTLAQATQSRILTLLDGLPPESLAVAERFVQFLYEQAQQGRSVVAVSEQEERPPYRYPNVPMPASALDGLVGIMPPVGGDALAE